MFPMTSVGKESIPRLLASAMRLSSACKRRVSQMDFVVSSSWTKEAMRLMSMSGSEGDSDSKMSALAKKVTRRSWNRLKSLPVTQEQ